MSGFVLIMGTDPGFFPTHWLSHCEISFIHTHTHVLHVLHSEGLPASILVPMDSYQVVSFSWFFLVMSKNFLSNSKVMVFLLGSCFCDITIFNFASFLFHKWKRDPLSRDPTCQGSLDRSCTPFIYS